MKSFFRILLAVYFYVGFISLSSASISSFLDQKEEESFNVALTTFQNLTNKPTCFFIYAQGLGNETVDTLVPYLETAGINMLQDVEQADFIVVCGSKGLINAYNNNPEITITTKVQLDKIKERPQILNHNILPIWLEGDDKKEVLPKFLWDESAIDFRNKEEYCLNCFELLRKLYKLDPNDPFLIQIINGHEARLNPIINPLPQTQNNQPNSKLTRWINPKIATVGVAALAAFGVSRFWGNDSSINNTILSLDAPCNPSLLRNGICYACDNGAYPLIRYNLIYLPDDGCPPELAPDLVYSLGEESEKEYLAQLQNATFLEDQKNIITRCAEGLKNVTASALARIGIKTDFNKEESKNSVAKFRFLLNDKESSQNYKGKTCVYNVTKDEQSQKGTITAHLVYPARLTIPETKPVSSPQELQEEADDVQFSRGEHYYKGNNSAKDYVQAFDWYLKVATQKHLIAQQRLSDIYIKKQGIFEKPEDAFVQLQKEADNSPMVTTIVGWMYRDGFGVQKDEKKAFALFQKPAQQGYAEAQVSLGWMYQQGRGVNQDDKEAVTWFRKAAAQGHATAQRSLGWMYREGRGVNQDDKEAVTWYRKAAEQGDAHGQNNLGVMYREGRGVNQDDKEAVTWYRKAADQGNAAAQVNLGWMYENGRGVNQDAKEAVTWYRKAAEQGDARGQNNLGWMYREGRGVNQDDKEAVTWFRKAAAQGHATAQVSLGWMYENGRGVNQDDKEAVTWFRKAADQGHAAAQVSLGWMYENGRGVNQDDKEAVTWFRKAADQGHAAAQVSLGWMYDNGQGVAKDELEAVVWYRKAADQGYAAAQFNLGNMYANGQGVAKDEKEAVSWYRKAADQGHEDAKKALARLKG